MSSEGKAIVAVVEDDELDRQVQLLEREQITEQHRQAAVAGERDHLPATI